VIARYARPAMARVWSDERRLERWLEVELVATEERERRGAVPAGVAARLRSRARVDAERMARIEEEVGHDVVAFLSMLGESLGEDARHLHVGMTSSDVLDSALALQIGEAGALLARSVRRARRAAWALAGAHARTVMVGRTHGMHAEPITFGLKCLTWSEELGRDEARLAAALADCAVGKLSGAVGTLAHLDAATEVTALGRLGLVPEPVASQVVARDRHAALLAALAVLGGTLERVATEVRHLQRSEVREAGEPFSARQKGSSAMPHKRNPVRSERVSGLARLLRGYALAALENQALWHERDISHSSVERVILPDAFQVADFMAAETAAILEGLRVDPAAMRRNLDAGGGLVHSQRVLLALTASGLARDEAYGIVREHALAALEGGPPFRAALEADGRVGAVLAPEVLAECFDLERHLAAVDALFARATEPPPLPGEEP
jgi:adenylosuccinate lyase